MCAKSKRLAQFVDPGTMDDNYHDPRTHVCTMNTRIIHHHGLREAITLGLNHIPLKNTNIQEAIQVVVNTFVQVCQLLKVKECLDVESASKLVRTIARDKLIAAMNENLYGFRYSKPYIFSDKTVDNELTWLLKHMFISGLDKATSNACFICIFHIKHQTLLRLNGPHFEPCKHKGIWDFIDVVTTKIKTELTNLILELSIGEGELPYIMAIYKFYKQKYRWISNAFGSIYVNVATLLTISTIALFEEVKEWANTTIKEYKNFLKVETSIY
jgi:hypothetical protein